MEHPAIQHHSAPAASARQATDMHQHMHHDFKILLYVLAIVPLILLPLCIIISFQLGQLQMSCASQFASKWGILRNFTVYIPQSKTTPGLFSSFFTNSSSATLTAHTETLLFTGGTTIIMILPTPGVNLSGYNRRHILVSGIFTACRNTLVVDTPQNITSLR